MGYERKPKIFVLKFSDPEMEGLVVKAGSPSMETYLQILRPAEDEVSKSESLVKLFCESLIEWNLETNGVPVPTTEQGLRSQDLDFVHDVIDAWMDAVNGVPSAPLDQPSFDGNPLLEASMPMEALSESQAS